MNARALGGRLLGTAIVASTAFAIWRAIDVSQRRPLTDDASVRADLIGVAPHVSGPLTELLVVDNQAVRRGDLLFVVDPRPYEARLAQAEAELKLVNREIDAQRNEVGAAHSVLRERQAEYDYADDYLHRVEPLLARGFVTADKVEEARTRRRTASAALSRSGEELGRETNLLAESGPGNVRRDAAEARVRSARLDVDYCRVTAPFDGYVTNLNIATGDYAVEGRQVFALVDRGNWYVIGNFRETYLRHMRPGMAAEVYVLNYPGRSFRGEVQGIGWAVQQPDGPTTGLLPPVEPALNWVRLAQRFPVRVRLLDPPSELPLRVGQTAAVTVFASP
ncbi:MAG TPA: biotin/lipoyl-binding protein [Polyangiaceae bacterium]|jgi:multidrug resistance efflux pump|nr:biotin/lipoyl-binding protein [Polyangiaceae bacterium]